jgi:kumamolisin
MTDSPRSTITGSARDVAPGAGNVSPIDPSTPIELTVVLNPRSDGELGAEPGAIDAVTEALQQAGLEIILSDEPSRRVRARGPASAVSATFDTELEIVTSTAADGNQVTHRQRTGELTLPADLSAQVLAVLGIDNRPQARSQHRVATPSATGSSFTPIEIGAKYDFPADTDGTGQSVAIIELGGGYEQSDLDSYFSGLGVTSPAVTSVGVDGADNEPGQDPNGADGEVLLDIEVIGALAPGAAISVYFAPNSDAGFLDAISEAVHATPTPAAVSISWGQSEDQWTAQARAAMDAAFADAVKLNVVVTAAAGDNGSSDGAADGKDHCDFPASSPNVLGCGGTSLAGSSETVWNNGSGNGATGGGVSDTFDRPARQADVGVPGSTGRGVPDVAGNADPQSGYQVLVDGTSMVIGGTSAVAPLWAALVARFAQARGGLLAGFADALYSGASSGTSPSGFHDITSGDNGSFDAGAGWDACTGLGSPDATALLARLQGSAQGT